MTSSPQITLEAVAQALSLHPLVPGSRGESPILGALASDLLSFVMAEGKPGWVWVTIQTHSNVVAVATLNDMAAIIVASGFEPDEDTIARAEEEGVGLLTTEQSAYQVSGRLYELGIR